jgi:uncharacterized repeat protein (TIGR03803 family)
VAGLINAKGWLYGTTTGGGAYLGGTVFRITARGKEQVLHSFSYGNDGFTPFAGLLDVKGTFYGTTGTGGAYGGPSGGGTVFSLTP